MFFSEFSTMDEQYSPDLSNGGHTIHCRIEAQTCVRWFRMNVERLQENGACAIQSVR